MRNLFSLIGRFRRDRRGNIAVIFTIALLPILTAMVAPSITRSRPG